jgi:hypothetical protein
VNLKYIVPFLDWCGQETVGGAYSCVREFSIAYGPEEKSVCIGGAIELHTIGIRCYRTRRKASNIPENSLCRREYIVEWKYREYLVRML